MPHGHLDRGAGKIEHLTAFDGRRDVTRARNLARFELQYFPPAQLSPDELALERAGKLQHLAHEGERCCVFFEALLARN